MLVMEIARWFCNERIISESKLNVHQSEMVEFAIKNNVKLVYDGNVSSVIIYDDETLEIVAEPLTTFNDSGCGLRLSLPH